MSIPSQPNLFLRPDAKDQSLEFFWSSPDSDGGSAITSYVLTDGTITQTLPSNIGYYKLTGLTNGQSYSFTLAASNAIGLGPAASFRTVQPGRPPAAPTTFSTANAGGTSYQVQWTNAVDTGGASLLGTVLTAIPVDSNDQPDFANSNAIIRQSVDKSLQSAVIPLTPSYNYKVLIQTINDPGYSAPLLFTSTLNGSGGPSGTGTSLLSYARLLNTQYSSPVSPTSAGPLIINSQSIGNHDFCVVGTRTISSFVATDYFTTTQDTASAWIVVKGDLTINSGQTFIPSVRKLFTVLYVTGNLVNNGVISMTARGANHSGTGNSGGFTAPADIRVGSGTFGAVTNPQIPATGGGGGAVRVTTGANNGTIGSSGGSGGGGSGYAFSGGTGGSGASGTSFSGGPGGGGGFSQVGTNAVPNGGAGGNGNGPTNNVTGGAGNPGGTPVAVVGGGNGTGGTLIVIVEGSLSGTGTIQANGVDSTRFPGTVPGGGSGGGSVTVLFGSNPSSAVTVTATGGSGQSAGNGGDGTARKLAIGIN